MKKRAMIGFNYLMYVFKFLLMISGIIGFILFVNLGINIQINTEGLSIASIYNRLYLSKSLSVIEPITGKMTPGMIDMQKFLELNNTKSLEKEIAYGNGKPPIGIKITLFDAGDKIIKTYYYESKISFDTLQSRSYASGIGATTEKKFKIPIILVNEDKKANGKIEYDIVTEKT